MVSVRGPVCSVLHVAQHGLAAYDTEGGGAAGLLVRFNTRKGRFARFSGAPATSSKRHGAKENSWRSPILPFCVGSGLN